MSGFNNGALSVNDTTTTLTNLGLSRVLKNLFKLTADKSTVDNTETSLFGTGDGSNTLAANYLASGTELILTGFGSLKYTNLTGAITVRLKLGSTTLVSAAFTPSTGIASAQLWTICASVICRSTGATGTVMPNGVFMYFSSASSSSNIQLLSTSAVTVDTTASQAFDLTAQYANTDAGNILTALNLRLDVA